MVRAIDERRKNAGEVLQAARQVRPGETFTAAGQTLTRSVTTYSTSGKIWADDPATGKRRDLAGARDKLAQIDRRSRSAVPVNMGMPASPTGTQLTDGQK